MRKHIIYSIIAGAAVGIFIAAALLLTNDFTYIKEAEASEIETVDYVELEAMVTGYNLVPEQTDDTPCVAASGKNICGRRDTIACPRAYAFGTVVEINGMFYVCEDRLSRKYDHRWDVNCDHDADCPALITGRKIIKIYN